MIDLQGASKRIIISSFYTSDDLNALYDEDDVDSIEEQIFG